jgi:hypothetical protein
LKLKITWEQIAPFIIANGHNKGKAAMKFGAMIIALVLTLPELALASYRRILVTEGVRRQRLELAI